MKKVLLIDAHSLIHRMYHAVPPLSNNKGEPTGALYGLAGTLLKVIQQIKPEYAVACFDRPEPTFRKEKFTDYKIHRPKADDDLVSQLIRARQVFEAFSITVAEAPGYEADDLIGTLATRFKKEDGTRVVIFTGDLDSLQLVDDGKVMVETFKKGISETILYDEKGVYEKLGVRPDQVVDYKALVGDASDNIPGVPGVGPKTATTILNAYETLENFFEKGTAEKAFEKINTNKDKALLSQELARIECDAPIELSLAQTVLSPDIEKVRSYMNDNQFSSLIRRLDDFSIKHTNNDTVPQPERQPAKELPPLPHDTTILILDADISIPNDDTLRSSKTKVGYDLKTLYKKYPFQAPAFDIAIALQLIGRSADSWKEACVFLFHQELPKEEFLRRAYNLLNKEIEKKKLEKVFYEIEMPLIPVLADMEERGIAIDKTHLRAVTKTLAQKIETLQKEIILEMGSNVNLNSPKQLLSYFRARGAKLTATGADKLDKIKEQFPIATKILAYRELFKLKTTYLDSFEKLVRRDGRIHPTFLQLGAATGRLSCQNPNLQNIPQESEWSRDIRNVFIPQEGYSFVAFDYSQIELRMLAAVAHDGAMMEAFKRGDDIHSLTAQKVFGVPAGDVTPAQRRLAKTLNFGIIYGMGFRALAQQSNFSPVEAKEFINKYFKEFSSVKQWQREVLARARRDEEVRNINGRLRPVPGINSTNPRLVSEMERIAINMPLQSLAADILKLAMTEIEKHIQEKRWEEKVKMLLTIHDELVFEIDNALLDNHKESAAVQEIKSIMETVYHLSVPIKADVKVGDRWGEMK